MYVHMCVRVYIYIYIYICICIHIHAHTLCVHIHILYSTRTPHAYATLHKPGVQGAHEGRLHGGASGRRPGVEALVLL